MFTKDSREENFLTLHGASWKYRDDITFKMLALNWQDKNNGRPRPKVEDAMIEYGMRMQGGSAAPAPILLSRDDGTLDVLDGVQRLGGAELIGVTVFPAYVVTASESMAMRLRVLANHCLIGDHGPDAAWNRAQAVGLLVIDGGMSTAEVALLGGWKKEDLDKERQYQEYSFAIRCIGGPEQLTKGVVENVAAYASIDTIKKAPKPTAEFFHDLKRGRFSNGDSKPHVKKFFDGTEKRKVQLHELFNDRLQEFRNEREVQTRLEGRTPTRRNPDVKLRATIKAAVTMTEDFIRDSVEILYVEEFYHMLNQVRDNLQKIAKRKGH